MQGVITTRDVVANARVIIHEFGVGAYLRCLAAAVLTRREVTFLEVIMDGRRSRGRPRC